MINTRCTRCEADMTFQPGFNANAPSWKCRACGNINYDIIRNDRGSARVCEGCGSIIDNQPGYLDKYRVWKCLECGYVNIKNDEAYVEEPIIRNEFITCGNCGNYVNENSEYCSFCGKKLFGTTVATETPNYKGAYFQVERREYSRTNGFREKRQVYSKVTYVNSEGVPLKDFIPQNYDIDGTRKIENNYYIASEVLPNNNYIEQGQYIQQPAFQQGKKPKSKWKALAICYFFGFFGGHKFYEGKTKEGILYLCTLGLCGVGWFIDLIGYFTKPNPYYVD